MHSSQPSPRDDCDMQRKIHLIVEIPGAMRGKESARGGRAGKRAFMPQATKDAEAHCRAHALAQVGHQRLSGALGLSAVIYQPVPASWSKRRQAAALANGGAWVTAKPDLTNILKLLEDSMMGVLWEDDAQIAHYGEMSKRYAERPRTVLTVWQLDESPS
jgi:Holliday junction resolvase RusA-like endonuclease